jgi:hypothetical protein
VVALIDRREQGRKMGLRPGFLRGGHQHQGQARVLEPSLERTGEARPSERDDALFDRPPRFDQVLGNRCNDGFRFVVRQVREQDDTNARAAERLAPEVGGEGIVELLGRRHSSSQTALIPTAIVVQSSSLRAWQPRCLH